MSAYLLEYPFGTLVYPGALAAIAHASKIASWSSSRTATSSFSRTRSSAPESGTPWMPRAHFPHKEQALDRIQERYPARRYVTVDDKPALLAAMSASSAPG